MIYDEKKYCFITNNKKIELTKNENIFINILIDKNFHSLGEIGKKIYNKYDYKIQSRIRVLKHNIRKKANIIFENKYNYIRILGVEEVKK